MSLFSRFSNFLTNIAFRLYHHAILPLRYDVRVTGRSSMDQQRSDPKGGILFLPSHPSHLDASMVGFALWEKGIRVYIWTVDYVFKHFFTRFAAKSRDTVKLLKVPNVYESRSAKHTIDMRRLIHRTVEKLRKGENVLFFPGGKQKHAAYEEMNGKSAVQRILKLYPEVNIVLVRIKGMWGSRFSRAVEKSERSDLRAHNWMRFMWNIGKIVLFNLIFFIPKRTVTLEFTPAGSDFPRNGTRKEINDYLEAYFNRGFGSEGEPLSKVSDYFWKTRYPKYEYHLKSYRYAADQIPSSLRQEVVQIIANKAGIAPEEIRDNMLLARDLSLDSLETIEILTELEKRYGLPKYAPKHVSSVGHLVALTANLPVDYLPVRGEFPQVVEEPASMVRAWHLVTSFVVGLFGFLDTQK
jgi:acyl carrier protein